MTDDSAPDAWERVWADQDETGPSSSLLEGASVTIAAQVRDAHRADRRRLIWLNVQEVAPAIAVAVFFALRLSRAARPWAVVVAVALTLGVAGFLLVTSIRQLRRESRWGASIREALVQRLDQVRHRARLYRTIAWWYLLPLVAAIVLVRFGADGELRLEGADIAYYGVVAVGGVGLYALNRRLGRTRYESEAARLESLLADIDAG